MTYLYNTLLYHPLLNALVFLYNTVAFRDLGVAIVLLTIIIRLILFPLFHKSIRYQAVMQEIQPKLKRAQEDHRHDPQKQTEAMMAVYRDHQVNPFSGIFFVLVQLPILIALYQIFLNSLDPAGLQGLYSFVSKPDLLHPTFLGLINLKEHSIVMVALAAAAQYMQMRLGLPKRVPGSATAAEKMSRQMVFVGPIITLIIFYRLPAAVSLYWFVTSLFSIVQQAIVNGNSTNGKLGNIREKPPRADGLRGL